MATPTTPPTFLASWHGGIMNHGDSVKVGGKNAKTKCFTISVNSSMALLEGKGN